MKYIIFLLLCHLNYEISAAKQSPKVIVIGAGPSGLAAASKLIQNGFDNVRILEAEDRIGGRVYSKEFGEYKIDVGAQWVHGEKDNVVFEMVWSLGLIERFSDWANITSKFFSSSGNVLPSSLTDNLLKCFEERIRDRNQTIVNTLENPSLGNYMELIYNEEFKKYSELNSELKKALFNTFDQIQMAADAADSWYQVSAKSEPNCQGDPALNWKENTYGIIIDILLKRYPNPAEELPVENKTMKNTKVTKIDYQNTLIKVSTANGDEFEADHVIFTPSLGVLKAKHEEMFDPALPPAKVNAINHFGYGHVAKILLYYDVPWWDPKKDFLKAIYWNESDRKELENDLDRRWMLSACYFAPVEHKPKLLSFWLTGKYVTEMEKVPEDRFRNETLHLISRFFGKSHNLTESKDILRSMWNTNENFLGTYSYNSIDAVKNDAKRSDIAEPVMKNGKPVLQFAGEATQKYHGTVHGAISSGYREADRLIQIYSKKS